MRVRSWSWLPWLVLAACGRSGIKQSDITVTPTAMQFGEVQLHATGSQSFTLANDGLTSDQVTLAAPPEGPFAWSEMSFSLGTHASIEIPVFFSPTELGTVTGTLELRWSSGQRQQDIVLSGTGTPFPCEVGSPDGTPCQLWWAPCAVGAACRGGVCHSASAEAEVPGNLRWTFPVKGAVPEVADPQGNIFSLLGAHSGTLALDACGQLLWQSQIGYDYLLLGGDTLVTVSMAGQVVGLSRRDGSQLWTADVGTLLGCVGSGAPCRDVVVNRPLFTNQGLLSFFATTAGSAGGETVTRLDFALDGGLLGKTSLAQEPKGFAIGSVVGDLQGNSYLSTFIDGVVANIVSFDTQGALRFQDREVNDPRDLAVSKTDVVGAGTTWSLDGNTSAAIPSPAGLGESLCGDVGAADSAGTFYCFTSLASHNAVMAVLNGGGLWATDLPSGYEADSNLALGDPGTIFVFARQRSSPAGNLLVALETANGGSAWTAQPFQTPLVGQINAPLYLTLTPAATLVTADPTAIYGVFAGQLRPPANAFWSRFGGTDANHGVPAPTAGP